MFIKKITKKDKKQYVYYRLCESYRIGDSVRHKNILDLGDLKELKTKEERKLLADTIESLINGQQYLFPVDKKIMRLAQYFYTKLINKGYIEKKKTLIPHTPQWEEIDTETTRDEESREIGASWLSKNMIDELGIEDKLKALGYDEKSVREALICIIARMVHPASDLKTQWYLNTRSGLCELFDIPYDKISRHKLTKASLMLYKIRQPIEDYLSFKTNELFDIPDKLFIYDLTNTYFEGKKASSELAAYGRSKEKRNDAKIIGIALMVNQAGFIKMSKFIKGNTNDSKTLKGIIEDIPQLSKKPVIVMDAGIATEDNLAFLKEKGYDYVCINNMKDYEENEINDTNPINLSLIRTPDDTYVYVKSRAKALKEEAMFESQSKRFEEGLCAIRDGIFKKGGTKKVDKVYERIGRLKEKFPSVHRYYEIHVSEKDNKAVDLIYKKIKDKKDAGVYFIRTSLNNNDETSIWNIYNNIREVESTFRCLKTDLKIRPVHHQYDINCLAHIYISIIAYQFVHSIRYRLKQKGIHKSWTGIVDIMDTQKTTTTSFINKKNKKVVLLKVSEPIPEAKQIYDALGYKDRPYRIKKFVLPEING